MNTMTLEPTPMTTATHEARTILVVDDDDAIRFVVQMMLQLEGHTVLTAADGIEGVRLAVQHEPDFVIVDYMMPGVDGEHTGRRVRAAAPGGMIIAFSAFLVAQPYWADLFVPKGEIGQLPEIICSRAASSRPTNS